MKNFKEYVIEQSNELDENVKGISVDKEFRKMNAMTKSIKEEWRDIRRDLIKNPNVPEKEREAIGDEIEDAILSLNRVLDKAQTKIKEWDK